MTCSFPRAVTALKIGLAGVSLRFQENDVGGGRQLGQHVGKALRHLGGLGVPGARPPLLPLGCRHQASDDHDAAVGEEGA